MFRFKRNFERLKDILIDQVYDYCYNDIVQRLEGDGNSITYDDPSLLKDEVTAKFVEQIKNSRSVRAYYTTRDTNFCQLVTEHENIAPSLTKKLELSGIRNKKTITQVLKAQEFLVSRSYFTRGNPKTNMVKLTEKGLRHYLDGKSFETEYINARNSNVALVISWISIVIALSAVFI